jgi:hypothetical protein
MNVTGDISRTLAPLPDGHPFFLRPSSWTAPYSSESGDYKAVPPTIAMRGPTPDSLMATSSGRMSMHLLSSSQAPKLLAFHLPKSTWNYYSSLDPYSTHDEAAPSDFRLEHQGRQPASTVAFPPPRSRVSAHRNSKKYRCHSCDTAFSQKQGLNRHNKDKHSQRNFCPYCSDFEWSSGRYYLFKMHLETKHPGAALPRTRRGSGRDLRLSKSQTLVPSLV